MLYILMLGTATGMRSMTPLAVLCWAAYLGYVPQYGWSAWTGSLAAVVIMTLLALGEWVGDVLPQTPSRTAAGPALARMVLGVFVGVLSWRSLHQPVAGGVVLGLLGALIGTYGGHRVRVVLSRRVGRDWPVGVSGSLLAAALAILACDRLHLIIAHPPVALLRLMHAGCSLAA